MFRNQIPEDGLTTWTKPELERHISGLKARRRQIERFTDVRMRNLYLGWNDRDIARANAELRQLRREAKK
jgi:hypothetical protein